MVQRTPSPTWSLCPLTLSTGRSHPARQTGLATRGQTQRQVWGGDRQRSREGTHSHTKGFLGAPCPDFKVLPNPPSLCFPLHLAEAVAGLVDTSAEDVVAQPLAAPPPLCPQGFLPNFWCRLCPPHAPGCLSPCQHRPQQSAGTKAAQHAGPHSNL